MQELNLENAETETEEKQPRRIEAEWSDSEWFQVWLELARRPYQVTEAQCNAQLS